MSQLLISGEAVSQGYAIGVAKWIGRRGEVTFNHINVEEAPGEIQKLEAAISRALADLQDLSRAPTLSVDGKEILEAHLQMLLDPELKFQFEQNIREKFLNVEWAVQSGFHFFREMLLGTQDDYLMQRAADLNDIQERILFYLREPELKYGQIDMDRPCILLCEELNPSLILSLERSHVLGFACQVGGQAGHAAILARAMGVPAVMGLGSSLEKIGEGELITLDAINGEVCRDGSPQYLQNFVLARQTFLDNQESLRTLKGQLIRAKDGRHVKLAANIATSAEVALARDLDAEAIGLYRTEFLFLNRNAEPSESEQIREYRKLLDEADGMEVWIRTLDIGGDKEASYLQAEAEDNPFLGLRALRLCLANPKIFKTQLRSLLQASVGKKIGIMFPMVSHFGEFALAREYLRECERELSAEGKSFQKHYKLGIMVEIPSVIFDLSRFQGEIDFVSIGTNDLLQYSVAADRLNPLVKKYYDPMNPGFQSLLREACLRAKSIGVELSVCGSLAHDPRFLDKFLEWGVDELSMSAQKILPTRKRCQVPKSGCDATDLDSTTGY